MASRPRTPDLTPAQITAVAGSVVGVAAAYGAPIPPEAQDGIVQTVQIVAPSLIGADLGLRWSRARLLERAQLDDPARRHERGWGPAIPIAVAGCATLSLAALLVALLT